MTQAFYRKWRPQSWDGVVGQDQVIQTLRNAVAGGRTGHAYLFAGPRGTGKTSTARLLAKALNCKHEELAARPCNVCDYCRAIQEGRFLDLIEIDAASNTSVEDVRDLRDKINFLPNQGRCKVYIIDEVHMLSTAAFNALLKTLEEPPPHAVFILATTEVHKIPATVLSRCQRHEFRQLPAAVIVPYLVGKVSEESLNVDLEVLPLIARQATGSLRDAVSLLDQLASTGEPVTLQLARDVLGTAADEIVTDIAQALIDNQPARGLVLIQQALDRGTDPRQFSRQLVDYLHALLLVKMGNPDLAHGSIENLELAAGQAGSLSLAALLKVIRIFQDASQERHSSRIPSLPLEIGFLEAIQFMQDQQLSAGTGSTGQIIEKSANGSAGDRQPVPAVGSPLTGAHGSTDPEVSTQRTTDSGSGRAPQAAGPAQETLTASRQSGSSSGHEQHSNSQPMAVSAQASSDLAVDGSGPQVFKTIVREWNRFLQEVRERDPILQGLINSSRPLAYEENALILGFEADILREKMLKPDNLDLAQAALTAVLGSDTGIRCVLSSQWDQSADSGVSAPGQPAAVRSRGFSGDAAEASTRLDAIETSGSESGMPDEAQSDGKNPEADHSGMDYGDEGIVATAVRQFGAQVVEVEEIEDSDSDED
jgi:DNA polymerase III subunit gamma/tau